MTSKSENPKKQNSTLLAARKKVLIQALIALQAIVITVVLIVGMSAAWYTNVVQTSGLQFQAKAWGFTGQAVIVDRPIEASPGDSGSIGLTVTNTGSEVTDVSVRVIKDQMAEQMKQRLFFYADTTDIRNGETLSRVYINTIDSYTYSLLGEGQLVLTQERTNDVPLEWQWVYDMLGYYFLGTVTQTTDGEGVKRVSTQVQDYLRPVEYDLDRATFADGILQTVDGTTATAQFLAQLSAADGYENDITATDMPGYYRVNVDQNGYGVWVYLCNWSEIQQATLYDSQLGESAAQAAENNTAAELFRATLTVVGQQSDAEYAEITTADALTDGLNSGGLLRLKKDIVLTEALAIDNGAKAVLDLNGHTVTGPSGSPLLQLNNAADLTVINGAFSAQDAACDVISVRGSALTLSNVRISGQGDDGIDVADEADVDSCVRLVGSTVDVSGCAVYLRGNGTRSESKTRIVIENSNLNSDYIGVMGSGNATAWGTDIQICRSTVSGRYAALYQPQGDSVTTVIDCALNGITAVVVKGGDMHIVNSTVTATGESQTPAYNGSGFTDTGDGIYVDGSYGNPMNVTVSGNSTVTSANSLAIRVFEEDIDFASVTVTGGTFSSDVSAFVPAGYVYDAATKTVSAVSAQEGDGNGE